MFNTRDLMARIQVKKDFFDDRQTFLQDTITILLNKDLIRKTFDENVSPDYFKISILFLLLDIKSWI